MRFLVLISLLFSINVQAQVVGTSLKFGEPTLQYKFISEDEEIIFEPNPVSETTVSFLGPSYAFGLQFSFEKDDDGDLYESTYTDFVISYYSKQIIADLYFRSFEDFYIQDDLEENNNADNNESINGNTFGVSVIYYFNESVFNLHNELIFTPQTGHDFFGQFKFEHQSLSGEDNIIPAKYSADFSKMNQIEKFNNDILEGQIGSSQLYSLESFYIASTISLGAAIESFLIEDADSKNITLVSPVGSAGATLAYYSGDFQFGIRGIYKEKRSQLNGVQFNEIFGSQYIFLLMFF